jgi:hypothetical protein
VEIQEYLEEAVRRDPLECVLPSKYNTFCLVECTLRELRALLPRLLTEQPSELATEMLVVGEVMRWTQIWLLESIIKVIKNTETDILFENRSVFALERTSSTVFMAE